MSELGVLDVSKSWDRNSTVWADQVRKGFDIYRETINGPSVFDLIGTVTGKRVLDAGCGEGYNARKLAQLGAQVTGIDVSAKMIELATKAETVEHSGINYHVCSFSKMDMFQDGIFDLVAAFMSLMDGPDYEGTLREMYRVLRPGGELVFSVTHPCFLTEGMYWTTDEHNQEPRACIGNYFKDTPFVDRWSFSLSPEAAQLPKFEVPYFPKTLSEYINGLLKTGYQLLEIREPRPTEGNCRKYPTLEKWRKHAAIYLQVKARKPPL